MGCEVSPLGFHLTPSIKEKICRGEYIYLLSLLPASKEFLAKSDKRVEDKTDEDRRRPIPRSFNNWLQAFCIFSSVLGEKFPEKCTGLFQHVDILLEAYKNFAGMAWFNYDDVFRQKLAVHRGLRWGMKDVGLWVSLMLPQRSAFSMQRQNQTSQLHKKGFCWAYNENQCKFANCRFKHECSWCSGGHPAQKFFCKLSGGALAQSSTREYLLKSMESGEVAKNAQIVRAYNGLGVDWVDNLSSVKDHPEVVVAKIEKECKLGRVAGPFDNPPFKNFRLSPLGVVPKKEKGAFRLIHHLSYPKEKELCSVSYAIFDQAVSLLVKCGEGALMAKCDVEAASR
ncbi:hypothetical protein XELAEV_18037311mg [Xenopus laevis]|uniref:C3H1-type domain-containing protein n=1 Tax=Xenopus laevis TaxID=8355 RepID=A0A974CC41_XENLA|nr:hypothetical protein XELAEV_18037311mg [Xenopus laevis]